MKSNHFPQNFDFKLIHIVLHEKRFRFLYPVFINHSVKILIHDFIQDIAYFSTAYFQFST